MECVEKSFKLAYTNLKDIVEALECYEFTLNKKADEMASRDKVDVYKKATYESKARKAVKIADLIKKEINYCAKCGKGRKEREETGMDGMAALISKES